MCKERLLSSAWCPAQSKSFWRQAVLPSSSNACWGGAPESPEQFARRITHAEREPAEVAFDYVVFNRAERLDDAVAQIQAIIKAEQQRVRPRRIYL
jgi:hypothetical protein